jgi:hypothetical protein
VLGRFRQFVLRGTLVKIALGIVISTILSALITTFAYGSGLLTEQTYERKMFWIGTCVIYAAWFWWGCGVVELIKDVRQLFRT